MKRFFLLALIAVFFQQFAHSQLVIGTSEFTSLANKSVNNDTLLPPVGLQAQVTDNDVLLWWSPPNEGPGQWLTYSDSVTATLIGLTEGGTWQAAARWDQEQLLGFGGETISKVEFLPGSELTNYTLKIWQGFQAETLIYEKDVTSVDSLVWNEILLDEFVTIDENSELWVGFEMSQGASQFPMGVDFGPAVTGFGDLIQTDSSDWFTLTELGLSYNWNIRVFVSLPGQDSGPEMEVLLPELRSVEQSMPAGYLVYRNGIPLMTEPQTELQFQDFDLANDFYTYTVTAVYDTLESEPDSVLVQIGGPELTLVPDSLVATIQSGSSEQLEIMLLNSGNELLEWSAQSQVNWMNLTEADGELQPGDSASLTIFVDATNLISGIYNGSIQFSTNKINNPVSDLSVVLIVTGNAALSLSADTLDFGNVVLDQTSNLLLFIENTGTDDLLVTSIESTNEFFTLDESAFFLNPGEIGVVQVSFSPTETGDFSGSLVINSNAPGQEVTEVALSGSGTLAPPLNFQATVDANLVNLSWLNPSGGPGNWLYYGDGEVFSAIGLTDGGLYQIASRWEASQLADYKGEYLVKTQFYFFSGVAEYTLKIWEVDSLPVLVYSQFLGQIEDSLAWNEVFLDEPFPIDGESELLIGYEINQEAFAFPAGVDAGPAVYGYGDLISIDSSGWQSLSDYGLDFNWSIQAYVSGDQGPVQIPATGPANQKYFDQRLKTKIVTQADYRSSTESSDLIGYNLYRDGFLLNEIAITETAYTDTISEAGTYSYTLTAIYEEGESSPAGPVTVVIDSAELLLPANWVMVESPVHHAVTIPESILFHDENDLKPGDFIGVFFENGEELTLAGMLHWEGKSNDLYAYGDHYLTPEKDGFLNGDKMIWKIYRTQDDKEYDAEAVYDMDKPENTGEFIDGGESGLLALKLNALSVTNSISDQDIVLYPNPARETIHVSGIPENTSLSVYSSDGRKITDAGNISSHFKMDITSMKKGIYLIVLTYNGRVLTKPFVVE